MSFKIHFLVPDDDGPIESEPAGEPVKVSEGGRFRVACDPSIQLSPRDRGTGEPYCVVCAKCRELLDGELAHLDRPHPREAAALDRAEP